MDIAAILRQRNRQSFDWLYNRYSALLFGLIRKMAGENVVAENLLMETFIAVWKTLDDFDGADKDLLIRMLRIARVKVTEYVAHGDQYRQGEEQLTGMDQPSWGERPAGHGQYANW